MSVTVTVTPINVVAKILKNGYKAKIFYELEMIFLISFPIMEAILPIYWKSSLSMSKRT